MKQLVSRLYDISDLVTAGKISYVVEITKGKDELVKCAHVPSFDELSDIPDEQFALILYHPHLGSFKKYAMTDKYLTEINLKVFEDKMDSLPDELVKVASYHLSKAAKFYRISVPEKIKKYAATKQPTNIVNIAEVDESAYRTKTAKVVDQQIKYALNKKYPISTPELVKKAMSYFDIHWAKFTPADAITFAANVKLAAAGLNVPFEGEQLKKYARLTSKEFNTNFRTHLKVRKGYTDEENRGLYDELYTKSAELGVIKTAEILEKLDRKTGVYRQWNRSVEDPIFSTLGFVKTADSVDYNGKSVQMTDLMKLSTKTVDDATLKELKGFQGLEVFDSLPKPIKDNLVEEMGL